MCWFWRPLLLWLRGWCCGGLLQQHLCQHVAHVEWHGWGLRCLLRLLLQLQLMHLRFNAGGQ